MDRNELIAAFNAALNERDRIDAETHRVHHEYVRNLIVCSERRRQIFDSAVKQMAGWAMVAAVGWLGFELIKVLRGW